MHELSLCEAIAQIVRQRADGRRVRRVTVRIGHLRQVVPDSLELHWQMLTEGTGLMGVPLDIEHVPAVVRCRVCGAQTELTEPILLCGSCDEAQVEVVQGRELQIASLDLATAAS